MPDPIMPPALVTVMTIRPWGGVDLERFECEYAFRPMWTNPQQVYSSETHRQDATISTICRSGPVDVATWMHRAGVWDQLPREP